MTPITETAAAAIHSAGRVGGGGRIVNFSENHRALNVSLPDYFWLYERDCGK